MEGFSFSRFHFDAKRSGHRVYWVLGSGLYMGQPYIGTIRIFLWNKKNMLCGHGIISLGAMMAGRRIERQTLLLFEAT